MATWINWIKLLFLTELFPQTFAKKSGMKGLYCKLGEAKELKFIIQEAVSIDSIVQVQLDPDQ